MNIIDRLTLLFLTLSAVKSAIITTETEKGPIHVISLIEVFNKSLCKPRELLVKIQDLYPRQTGNIFIPSCVVLMRCGGCCNDEMLHCLPTSSHNITMQVKRIRVPKQQNDILMKFTEHDSCECRVRPERQQKGNVCEPCCDHCSERRKRLFVQDPASCRCSCKHTDEYCRERQQELNERTCRCDRPR